MRKSPYSSRRGRFRHTCKMPVEESDGVLLTLQIYNKQLKPAPTIFCSKWAGFIGPIRHPLRNTPAIHVTTNTDETNKTCPYQTVMESEYLFMAHYSITSAVLQVDSRQFSLNSNLITDRITQHTMPPEYIKEWLVLDPFFGRNMK